MVSNVWLAMRHLIKLLKWQPFLKNSHFENTSKNAITTRFNPIKYNDNSLNGSQGKTSNETVRKIAIMATISKIADILKKSL